MAPIHRYYSKLKKDGYDIIQYIGIAIDEPERLKRISGNKVSLLQKYGYTEKMAMELCKKYDLVSPIYAMATRGGCWFCQNCRLKTFWRFRKEHPELWNELKQLSLETGLVTDSFKRSMTFAQVEERLDAMDAEFLLF